MFSLTASSPSKPFFIGIDSDGTVFDSMEIKHKRVFQPVAMEIFGLSEVADDYYHIAEAINLYSTKRGINRFEALALAFKRLAEQSDAGARVLAGHEDLVDFIASRKGLSSSALASYNHAKQSQFLAKVLEWSRQSDALYKRIMENEGTPVFPRVKTILQRALARAEVVVISSSSRATLEEDWEKAGLLPFVTRIEGQEQGNKAKQLEGAFREGREPNKALMIGDALSDFEAAKTHRMLFYPITPGDEEIAWEHFEKEALNRFFHGRYSGAYEEGLLLNFKSVLENKTQL